MKRKLAKELCYIGHQRIHVDRQEKQAGFTSSAASRPDWHTDANLHYRLSA